MKIAVLATLLSSVGAFVPSMLPVQTRSELSMKNDFTEKAAAIAAGALLSSGTFVPAVNALTKDEINQLTYLQVKGTGLANRCSEVVGEDTLKIKSSGGKLVEVCIEPKQFFVEEVTETRGGKTKSEFLKTKLMTRQTYTLDGLEGPVSVEGGKFTWKETDGIDYAATTVQLPGGERVPFLFTVKELVAKGDGSEVKPGFQFGGSFKTPSYRTGLFLDPKGRGGTTGYDMAVALPGLQSGEEGDKELFKENNKVFDVTPGSIEFEVQRVNAEESEFGGVFVQTQKGDTDMGSKEAKNLLIKGIFYAKYE